MPHPLAVLPLPKAWSHAARSAVLHAVSLAATASTFLRGWRQDSPLARERLEAELERTKSEIALLQEEIRIKDARMTRISPHRRPYYSATDRMAILEVKSARCWSQARTAHVFNIDPQTVRLWIHRLDTEGEHPFVDTPEPVNRYPDYLRHLIRRFNLLFPLLGRKRIADLLARAGLHIASSTVRRILKEVPRRPPSPSVPREDTLDPKNDTPSDEDLPPRTVTARVPNHLWHIDFTVMPTAAGFWVPWLPHALLQHWPFAWWIAVVVDHFSRKIVAGTVSKKRPTSIDARILLGRAIGRIGKAPRHLVCDRDGAFDCEGFRLWCRRKGVRPRYGRASRHGSIAVVERLIRSMKDEGLRRILVPQGYRSMRNALEDWTGWYNQHRPHTFLNGATPDEVYQRRRPANRSPRWEPRPRWPKRSPCAAPNVPIKGTRGAKLELIARPFRGRAHLPVVEIRRAG